MSQVLQTSCDYKIKTQPAGTITLDTSQVIVTGNLRVDGEQVVLDVTNLAVEDNLIRLNKGETGNGVTEIYSGIEVDRGFISGADRNLLATFWFNENSDAWEIVEQLDSIISFNNSNLRLRRIFTDAGTDNGNLTLIGTGFGVVNVEGTTDYEDQVQADDDIPNKVYVDRAIANREPNNRIQRDDSYVIVQDIDGGASARVVVAVDDGVSINLGGLNYVVGDLIVLSGGNSKVLFRAEVATISPGGVITGITVLDAGEYVVLPPSNNNVATTTDSLLGSGATLNLSWKVADVDIISPGNDYQTATITFSDGYSPDPEVIPPATATGTVIVDLNPSSPSYRQVIDITVDSAGLYYEIPTVTFSSGLNPSLTESQISVVVDNEVNAVFYKNRTNIGDLEILNNTVSNNNTNENIILNTNGTAAVEITTALQLDKTGAVIPFVVNSSILYADPSSTVGQPTVGGTGIYYNNEKQTLAWQQWVTNNPNSQFTPATLNVGNYPAKNELISKNKALVMSMLF
jgi:hypothetical protein